MTAKNELDHNGILRLHPLAELLVEIGQARLNGSLRLANAEHKVIIYFNSGEVIYAISNARAFRLFDILLRENKIDKEFLTANPNFTNDLELAKALAAKRVMTPEEVNEALTAQMAAILKDSIGWEEGDWSFSPLARLREGIRFKINIDKLLIAHARKLTPEAAFSRFKSVHEIFKLKSEIDINIDMQPHEAFVLSRFGDAMLTVEEVKMLSGMPDSATFHTLYTLWLGGFLVRTDWNAAFSDKKVASIKSAKLELKKEAEFREAEKPVEKPVAAEPEPRTETEPMAETAVEEAISLKDYLSRSENASTHYEMIGIDPKVEIPEVKQAYFALAKRFHPDHFHHVDDPLLVGRIQSAFTKLAQAYDILKGKDSREAYDFKMRRELAEQEKRAASGASKEEINQQVQSEQAAENFEQGFSLLMDEEFEAATPFLARAVFLASDNPKYHAYYGKALSGGDNQTHKAEAEMQMAIKLDSTNPTFRLILAEFFIQMNMIKRAEGELTRLLQVFPSNREAATLLDSLRKK
jgi:curved DNA-binding protein CbpA